MKGSFTRRDVLGSIALGGAATLVGVSAPSIVRAADKYPSRPIKIMIPFAPGGGSDRLTRVFIPFLQKELGQPLTVEYMPGGGTVLGNSYLLAQKPDGYTISNTGVNYTAVTIAQGLAKYKAEDFWPINLPSRDFTLGAVASDSPITSFKEVLEKLRKDPKSLSLGMQAASVDYLNLILALRAAGVDTAQLRVVTYDGGGVVRNAVMGSQVDVGFVGAEGYLPLMSKIKPLVGFWDKALFPEFDSTPSIVKIGSRHGLQGRVRRRLAARLGDPDLAQGPEPGGLQGPAGCVRAGDQGSRGGEGLGGAAIAAGLVRPGGLQRSLYAHLRHLREARRAPRGS